MKRLILILGFLVISCSSDGNSSSDVYKIKVDSGCPRNNVTTTATYTVSKETFDRVEQGRNISAPCNYATFNDVDAVERKGYVVNMSVCNYCQ